MGNDTPNKRRDMSTMQAFHNDTAIKAMFLDRIAQHAAEDAIVKGQYWKNGKGCAIGCTYHSSDHMTAEREAGIPVALARLEDTIFEGLPNDLAMTWPARFMAAVPVGADLSLVVPRWMLWLLTESGIEGYRHPTVAPAVEQVAAVLRHWIKVGVPDRGAADSAESAVWGAAWNVAWSAARSAESAARSAAWSAESAARAAWSAAESAAAESAARSAARSVARSVAWGAMSDALLRLIAECRVTGDAA